MTLPPCTVQVHFHDGIKLIYELRSLGTVITEYAFCAQIWIITPAVRARVMTTDVFICSGNSLSICMRTRMKRHFGVWNFVTTAYEHNLWKVKIEVIKLYRTYKGYIKTKTKKYIQGMALEKGRTAVYFIELFANIHDDPFFFSREYPS